MFVDTIMSRMQDRLVQACVQKAARFIQQFRYSTAMWRHTADTGPQLITASVHQWVINILKIVSELSLLTNKWQTHMLYNRVNIDHKQGQI